MLNGKISCIIKMHSACEMFKVIYALFKNIFNLPSVIKMMKIALNYFILLGIKTVQLGLVNEACKQQIRKNY